MSHALGSPDSYRGGVPTSDRPRRLVVRYRIEPEPATPPRLTDVVGTLVANSPDSITIQSSHGLVEVPKRLIVAARDVPEPRRG